MEHFVQPAPSGEHHHFAENQEVPADVDGIDSSLADDLTQELFGDSAEAYEDLEQPKETQDSVGDTDLRISQLKELSDAAAVNLEKLARYFDKCRRPYAGGKAFRLRKHSDKMETMIAHMLGVGKAVDDRGLLLPAQVEKERPDYFAIASCIQEDDVTIVDGDAVMDVDDCGAYEDSMEYAQESIVASRRFPGGVMQAADLDTQMIDPGRKRKRHADKTGGSNDELLDAVKIGNAVFSQPKRSYRTPSQQSVPELESDNQSERSDSVSSSGSSDLQHASDAKYACAAAVGQPRSLSAKRGPPSTPHSSPESKRQREDSAADLAWPLSPRTSPAKQSKVTSVDQGQAFFARLNRLEACDEPRKQCIPTEQGSGDHSQAPVDSTDDFTAMEPSKQGQDIAVSSRLALAVLMLQEAGNTKADDLEAFSVALCGEEVWQDRMKHYTENSVMDIEPATSLRLAQYYLEDMATTLGPWNSLVADGLMAFAQTL